MRPPNCNGRTLSRRPAPPWTAHPLAVSTAAPTAGNAAAEPGYGVRPLKTKADATTAVSPSQPPAHATGRGSRARADALTATRPPRPSSQALVPIEKYAHGGSVLVLSTE